MSKLDPPPSMVELVKDNLNADSVWKKWFNNFYEYVTKSIVLNFNTTSVALTADKEVVVLVDTSGGAVTVTLNPAAENEGRCYYIKDTDGGANAVTIDANGSETIDGSLTLVLATARGTAKLICDGANWHRIGN